MKKKKKYNVGIWKAYVSMDFSQKHTHTLSSDKSPTVYKSAQHLTSYLTAYIRMAEFYVDKVIIDCERCVP